MKKKVGIYICQCGPNIADNVDIDKIIESVSAFNDADDLEIVAKPYGLLCSGEGKDYLKQEIEENGLTHLVIGACSPRDHNNTFIGVCKETSLNPYLYKLINIREHCAWIIHDKDKATEKAIQYIRGGLRRVLYQSELFENKLDTNPDVLVIGGGIAGIEAALSLADADRQVFLIEKTDRLGGKAATFKTVLPKQQDAVEAIQLKIQTVQDHPHIQVMLNTRLDRIIGFLGNFEAEVRSIDDAEKMTELKIGAMVVASGFSLYDASTHPDFIFSGDDEVYTALQIEQMIAEKNQVTTRSGKAPKSVAMIHCVGREEVGYCSQICCNAMIKLAARFKTQSPDTTVKVFFRDLCLPHQDDQAFYNEIKAQGVEFVRVNRIATEGSQIKFTTMDENEGSELFDMVVLAPAMIPADGTPDLATKLGISLHETGFFQEAHQAINPVATATDGIFIVGTAHGPRGIQATLLQAQAAASKIRVQLIPGEQIVPEVRVSETLEAFCMGCKTCLEVCHYGAIVFDEDKGISVVKEAVCRGCGNCVGSCPSGAIQLKHFTNPQLYQEMIEAVQ